MNTTRTDVRMADPPELLPEALAAPEVWWRETTLRALVLLTFAVLVEVLFHGAPLAAYGAHPHPYWLVVLPLAASRGLVGGLVGAGSASALVLAAAVLDAPAGVGVVRALAAGMLEPLLFCAAAVVVGELCDSVRGELRDVEAGRRELADDVTRIRYEREVLEATARELERRLAYGPGGVGGVIGAAKRMQSSDVDGLYAATLDLVVEHVGDAAAVVEVGPGGRLTLARAHGGPKCGALGADRDLSLTSLSPLVEAALQRGEATSAFELGGDSLPPGPRMVAPLFDHTRAVRALLLLDEVGPERLGPATFRTFTALAEWASAGLARIALGSAPLVAPAAREGLERATPSVPRRLGSPERLALAVAHELARCERHALNLTVLGVQFSVDGDHNDGALSRLDAAVVEQLTRGLRASDGLFAFGFPGCYAVVLAGTDVRGAALARARLEANAAVIERRAGLGARVTVVGPEHGEVSVDLVLDTLAQRFRAAARRPLGIPERAPHDPHAAGDLADLAERLAAEASLEHRFGIPFQLLEVRLSSPAGLAHALALGEGRLPADLAEAVHGALRRGTAAFAAGGGRYLFLLPGLPAAAAHLVLARLESALDAHGVAAAVGRAFDSESGVDVGLLVTTLVGGRAA